VLLLLFDFGFGFNFLLLFFFFIVLGLIGFDGLVVVYSGETTGGGGRWGYGSFGCCLVGGLRGLISLVDFFPFRKLNLIKR
jgi:hypothetical protein